MLQQKCEVFEGLRQWVTQELQRKSWWLQLQKMAGTEFQGLNRGEDEINLRSNRGRSWSCCGHREGVCRCLQGSEGAWWGQQPPVPQQICLQPLLDRSFTGKHREMLQQNLKSWRAVWAQPILAGGLNWWILGSLPTQNIPFSLAALSSLERFLL